MSNWKNRAALLMVCFILASIAGCKTEGSPDGKMTGSREAEAGRGTFAGMDNRTEENQQTAKTSGPEIRQADFSEEFQSVEGCAVLLDSSGNTITFYQEEMCRTQVSPASTFKVVSALSGLHHGILLSKDSKMGYEGRIYSVDAWNQDVNLAEAFQSSCVWYFRKVIDAVGQEGVQRDLDGLGYGNCDISQWEGSNVNNYPELNGFWLESSLKISPLEQVEVLQNIVEGNTIYTESEVAVLKEIMLVEEDGSLKIYGKTGSGRKGHAWFVGFANKEDTTVYFAVYLEDE